MKNTFAENIVDFLKLYDPFKTVAYGDLLEIASQSEIIYLEKSKRLLKLMTNCIRIFTLYILAKFI